jgi:isopropylmalate/homocitrate/citramalate synthase
LKVTFFTIDSTRAPFNVFWRLVGTVAKEGHMDALAVADTFGVMNPEATSYFIKRVMQVTKKPVEIHAHNDFGLGVANTIAAVLAGAGTVHVTVNGIGERSGNTSLEETVMALRFLYGIETNVKTKQLRSLSLLVRKLSGIRMPPQKPVVGDSIFTFESGIIAGWWKRVERLGIPLEMFPFMPELVGHGPVRMVLGKKSGRDSIVYYAEKKGIRLEEPKIDEVLMKVKEKAIQQKRALRDTELKEIIGGREKVVAS